MGSSSVSVELPRDVYDALEDMVDDVNADVPQVIAAVLDAFAVLSAAYMRLKEKGK